MSSSVQLNHLEIGFRDCDLFKYRVPTRSGNREKVGNFVIGREVGKMSGKTKHLKKSCCVGKKSIFFLYRGLGLDLFSS